MTYAILLDALRSCTADVYETAIPKGIPSGISITCYGESVINADDRSFAMAEKVQLDVFWQSSSDSLLRDVYAALTDACFCYEVQDVYYDPDYARMRGIIQLEVL